MTMEDLREQGVILPEEEWGVHDLETTVPEWTVGALLLLGAASLVVAYLGDGAWLTWAGVGVFVLALLAVAWICHRAIEDQRERVEREREEAGKGVEEKGGEEGAGT